MGSRLLLAIALSPSVGVAWYMFMIKPVAEHGPAVWMVGVPFMLLWLGVVFSVWLRFPHDPGPRHRR